jgi:hypothetical protein
MNIRSSGFMRGRDMQDRSVRAGNAPIAWVRFAILLGVTAAICGCGGGSSSGPKREAVTGTITLKGEPVEDGQVSFEPVTPGPTASTVVKAGKYRFSAEDGPVAGKHKVKILVVPQRDLSKGGPRKDAPTVESAKGPADGWKFDAEVRQGQSEPLDYKID